MHCNKCFMNTWLNFLFKIRGRRHMEKDVIVWWWKNLTSKVNGRIYLLNAARSEWERLDSCAMVAYKNARTQKHKIIFMIISLPLFQKCFHCRTIKAYVCWPQPEHWKHLRKNMNCYHTTLFVYCPTNVFHGHMTSTLSIFEANLSYIKHGTAIFSRKSWSDMIMEGFISRYFVSLGNEFSGPEVKRYYLFSMRWTLWLQSD